MWERLWILWKASPVFQRSLFIRSSFDLELILRLWISLCANYKPVICNGRLAQPSSGDNAAKNERQSQKGHSVIGITKDLGVVEEDHQHANRQQPEQHVGNPRWARCGVDLLDCLDIRLLVTRLSALWGYSATLNTTFLRT